MLICLFGESCTGKSTIARQLSQRLDNARIFSGKDYLKLAKNENDAKCAFMRLLLEAQASSDALLFVVTEKEQLSLLPERCVRVLVTAELPVIKERFAARTGGTLPAPVEAMLERKHGLFDSERHDIRISSGDKSVSEHCEDILEFTGARGG